MKSKKGKRAQAALLSNNNPISYYMLETNWLESSFEEKDLGVFLDKLNMSQQASLWQRWPSTSWSAEDRTLPVG